MNFGLRGLGLVVLSLMGNCHARVISLVRGAHGPHLVELEVGAGYIRYTFGYRALVAWRRNFFVGGLGCLVHEVLEADVLLRAIWLLRAALAVTSRVGAGQPPCLRLEGAVLQLLLNDPLFELLYPTDHDFLVSHEPLLHWNGRIPPGSGLLGQFLASLGYLWLELVLLAEFTFASGHLLTDTEHDILGVDV